MAKTLVQIGQLAELVDVPITTLNHYINMELLRPARRSNGGYRLFDPDKAQEILERIASLKAAGKKLDEIRRILRRKR